MRNTPVLNGTYGVLAAPRIVAFTADDPDNFDEVYSAGDTLTLVTDIATDGLLPPRAPSGDRTFVDELFAFSHSLGAEYSGEWSDASTFVIHIIDVGGAGTPTMSGPCQQMNLSLAELPEDYCTFNRLVLARPPPPLPPGSSGTPPPPPSRPAFAFAYVEWPPPIFAFFNASAELAGSAGRTQTTREPTALVGSFGRSAPPALLAFTAADIDNANHTFSEGDTLSLVFDMRTNMAATLEAYGLLSPCPPPELAGCKAYVDTLLEFSSSLGIDYSGGWQDESTLVVTALDTTDAAPPRIGLTQVTVLFGEHNITNEHGSSVGCMDTATLGGSFGSARPPRLLSVTIDDVDNGDEVYGYCDTITFAFDMPTDKAHRESIDVYDLFYFANPVSTLTPECDVPYAGECPVYDIVNGLGYTSSWSADGSEYTLQLECPVPAGTPAAAAGNNYAAPAAPPYLVGNRTTPCGAGETCNGLGSPQQWEAYEIRVGRLQLGVTRVRLRADVQNSARTLRQPLLSGEFGSITAPMITNYTASNFENADSIYGQSDLLTIIFDKPTDKAGGERYGLKSYVDGLFSFSEGDPADDYSGEWRDDSTFVVGLIDPTDIIPSVAGRVPFSTRPAHLEVATAGSLGPPMLPGALIQNRGVSSDRIASSSVIVPVSGDFGEVASPTLTGFDARDLDNGDAILSEGDQLVLTFSVATDRGGATRTFYPSDAANVASQSDIDRLFSFSSSVGEEYTGLWVDERTFIITIVNATGGDAFVGATLATVRDELGGLIFNAAGNSAAAQGSRHLGGSFGELSAPSISTFYIEARATSSMPPLPPRSLHATWHAPSPRAVPS